MISKTSLWKCLHQPSTYMVSDMVWQLYMCRAERAMAKQLTDCIETWDRRKDGLRFVDPYGSLCSGIVGREEGRDINCYATKGTSARILPRKVTLFTLNHDLISVVLNDLVCPSCGFENRYSGESHGIFPAAKHRAFTVELLYFWMHESMGRGLSFRSIFELTCNLHNSCSYRRRIDTTRLDMLAPEFNETGSSVMKLREDSLRISISWKTLSAQLNIMDLKNCEVELTDNDCKQLGLATDDETNRTEKRFKALLMDGKVLGALRYYPVSSCNVQQLVGTKGLTTKLVNNRKTRSALKHLTKYVRRLVRAVEYGRAEDVKENLTEKNGVVVFRLEGLKDLKGVTKSNY